MGTSDPLVVFKITILQVNCVTIHEAYHQNSLSLFMGYVSSQERTIPKNDGPW